MKKDNNDGVKNTGMKNRVLNRGSKNKSKVNRGPNDKNRDGQKDRLNKGQNPNNKAKKPNNHKARNKKSNKAVKVIPLGGLNEIGKNITAIEYDNEIIIVDCGQSFPEDEMFGIDVVIPNFEYLEENSSKIKGLILTHGHEDHIGGIPYMLKKINMPIYGTKLTLGLVKNKLVEHGLRGDLRTINAGDKFKVGSFDIEAIRITHSIADSVCFAINTPAGLIFHTGDFKIDYTPVDGEPIDFQKLAEIGREGVLLMLSDSTNAVRKGFTESEKTIGKVMDNIFKERKSRILIATFASNVHRIQSIIDAAVRNGRKVALSGRSMLNVMELAQELGYIKIPSKMLVDLNQAKNIPDHELAIITTGSQGEPMSALARMATSAHKAIQIKKGDTVILSSSPIPGNEKTVAKIVDQLLSKGAEVIYSDIADIHVSGHACQEELKMMLAIMKPKFFVPVHGEYRHLYQHASIAKSLGMKDRNVQIMGNGQVLEIKNNRVSLTKDTVPADPVFVDGLGVGDVGDIVLKDRRLLSESGLIIVIAGIDGSSGTFVSGPDIISRGFVFVKENEDLIAEMRNLVNKTLNKCEKNGIVEWSALKNAVRGDLRKFIYEKTKRNPVILPIFMEV